MQTLFPAIHGYRVNPGIELSKGWTPDELKNVMYGLASDPADRALLLESCSGSEADALLNPGTMILEAVTAQYNRLPRTMAALSRVLGRYLGNGLTIEGEPFIGPDRKNALFAYKVVTFNISDGQTVSVLFHSPDSDPKRFQPEETLIAYRWMLNKRDITASVAPERGRDITLELMARRMAQLIESNSAKFQEQAAARDARIAELEQATARRDELSAMSAQLADEIVSFEDELQAIQARASRTAERLSAERARAERLRGAGVGAGNAGGGSGALPWAQIEKLLKWRSVGGGVNRLDFADPANGRVMNYGTVEDTSKTEGRDPRASNKWRTSDGELHADLATAKKHEIETGSIPRLVRDGYVDPSSVPNANDGTTQPDTGAGDAGTTQPEPTQAESGQVDGDVRGMAFAVTNKSGAVVTSGTIPAMMDADSKMANVAYYQSLADNAEGDLWLAKSATNAASDSGEFLIFGKTWSQIQAMQQGVYMPDVVKSKMPDGAVKVYSHGSLPSGNGQNTTNPDKPSSTEAFATTPYADPRTRYASALAEELAMAGFTPYDFPVNQSDFELGQYTAVAGMEMVAGRASVYVDSIEAGQAKVTARFSPESQPGTPALYSPSQEFTFPVPVGVLEGKFDDVVGEISGWLAQFGTAFDNVKLPEFGSKLKTEGVNEHDAADIAKRIRQDIKGVLPPGFKPTFVSVKTSKYSMGQSIGITIKQLPDGFPMYETKAIEDQYGRKSYPLTRDAAALLKTLKAIGNAYRFDNSEPETDYFHTNFYFNVSFDSTLESEQRALADNGGINAAYHRVLINSPFGNFHVFVEHSNEATTDDYKKDAKEAFISDSGIGNGVASVSQVKVVGEPEPVTSLPADATRAKNAAWAYISKVASESQGSQGEKASAAVSNGRPNATGTVGDEAAKGWRKAAYKRLEGSYLIDSPASDDNGVIEGVRRITVLTGNNIAHFHYAESNNAENSAAKAAAEAWAKGGNAQSDAVDQVEPQPSTPGNDPQPQEQTVNETEAIGQELQKLANGEVTDTGLFDQMLDDLADRAEKAGAMDELDALLNAAADKLTELLEKEAANVA